jgi:hypothetical protein
VIARLLLAVSLVLLVAAPAPALAGSVHIEIAEELAAHADDEAAPPLAAACAPSRARAPHRAPSEEIVPRGPVLARVFRPPRPPSA